MKKYLLIFLLTFTANVSAQDNTWRGLKIEKENRCSPYNRSKDYEYLQIVENKIVESLGNKIYSPYSGKFFKSIKETDIEHIVSLSEAHDSGLCAANGKTKNKFASDILNLTLASPTVNRDEKSGFDASGWLPEKNKCWFANKVIEVKKAYNLTVDSKELVALEKVISQCSSFEIVFFENKTSSPSLAKKNTKSQTIIGLKDGPNVKKSRSGICHSKTSSPYYYMTKHYQPFSDVQSCLNSGGRCPKRDSKCQNATTNNKENSYKNVSYIQKASVDQSTTNQGNEPNVKKSRSGICHLKNSSSSYSRTKNFAPYQSLELCLNSGGRCPKRDSQCQSVASGKSESPYKKEKVSHIKKLPAKQPSVIQGNKPNVKKSKSGICHSNNSSSHYSRLKNFTSYQSLELCLKSGGRCPKRDSVCNNLRTPSL